MKKKIWFGFGFNTQIFGGLGMKPKPKHHEKYKNVT